MVFERGYPKQMIDSQKRRVKFGQSLKVVITYHLKLKDSGNFGKARTPIVSG